MRRAVAPLLSMAVLAALLGMGRPLARSGPVARPGRAAVARCWAATSGSDSRSSSSDGEEAAAPKWLGPESPKDWNGIVCVDKPVGWTSSDVVVRVRRTLEQHWRKRGVKLSRRGGVKVGHGGTLDPLASGILVLGIGDGCKYMKDFLSGTKAYETVALFGVETDTLDSTGEVTTQVNCGHLNGEIVEAAVETFVGEGMQLPPAYSALKRGGEPLYAKARRGEEVDHLLEPRPVTIYDLKVQESGTKEDAPGIFDVPSIKEAMNFWDGDWLCDACGKKNFARREVCFSCKAPKPEEPEGDEALEEHSEAVEAADGAPLFAAKMYVECSGGFYVRSLVRDVGRKVDSGAHMTYLRRVKQGRFTVDRALPQDLWNAENLYRMTLAPKEKESR